MRSSARRTFAGMVMSAVVMACGAEAATYSGGAGTLPNPYRIGNATDWATLSLTEEDWDKYFALTADIDFGGASLTPVATFSVPFTGTFNGNGHILRNGRISRPGGGNIGLFSYLASGGLIRGLGVEDFTVESDDYVGGIVGCIGLRGVLESCFFTGTVTGDENVGGLVGENDGTLSLCFTAAAVTGNYCVGGLAGYTSSAEVASCYSTGPVMGGQYAGGLVGYGFAGTIEDCYATGAVTGGEHAGGLVGRMSSGEVIFCYATGRVAGTGHVGGLAGTSSGTVQFCYWDTETSGVSVSAGGDGRTTDEMTYPHALTAYVDWDFVAVWAEDRNHSLNAGYPYLLANAPAVDEAGCCRASGKSLSLKEQFGRMMGDWLIVGLSLMVLAAQTVGGKK